MTDPATAGDLPPQGRTARLVPLSIEAVRAVLDERGDRYVVGDDGNVGGRWGPAVVSFRITGAQHQVLHARVVAERRLPAGRLLSAYRFCNAWNHDRLLPAAHVHDIGDGELVIAGDVSTDLSHGVSPAQLATLMDAAVSAGLLLARAVGDLPDDPELL